MSRIKGGRHNLGPRLGSVATTGRPSILNYPVFCLRHLQDGYDVVDCQHDDQRQLVTKLRRLSRLDWSQVEQADRHGNGKENIEQRRVRRPMPALVTGDVKLWAIRFSGKKPMVGFRSGDIFHILWLDHSFDLYPH